MSQYPSFEDFKNSLLNKDVPPTVNPQYLKIREICERSGIDIPEMDTQITSLSTRTEIIADESVLDYVEPIYHSDADGFSPDYLDPSDYINAE